MAVDEAREVARGPAVGIVGRIGHAARGTLYAIVGFLAVLVAVGERSRAPDREGALRVVANQPAGELLLVLLGLGLLGFAIWRLAQGLFAREGDDGTRPGLPKRVGYTALGLFYGFTAGVAFVLAFHLGAPSGNEQQETAGAFDLPLGRYAVGLVGVGLIVAGVVNVYRSLTQKFRKYLREHELGKTARDWAIALGVVGHLARAAVFSLVGTFVLKAAVEYDASEAVGLDGALAKLAQQPLGPVLLGAVAAGLLAFAAFCFVQALHGET